MCFHPAQLAYTLNLLDDAVGQYMWLRENLHATNVATDETFQRTFNRLYQLRRRLQWRHTFFSILEARKANPLPFDEALDLLFLIDEHQEASFASKLVATIDYNRAVIDKRVLRQAGLRLPLYGVANRRTRIIETYHDLEQWMSNLRDSECGHNAVAAFRQRFPDANISETKILDFILWKMPDT